MLCERKISYCLNVHTQGKYVAYPSIELASSNDKYMPYLGEEAAEKVGTLFRDEFVNQKLLDDRGVQQRMQQKMRKRAQFEKGVKFSRIIIRTVSIVVAVFVLNLCSSKVYTEPAWIANDKQDCYAADADFVPLYHLKNFKDPSDNQTYMTHGTKQRLDDEPTLEYFQTSYINVSGKIRSNVITYLVLNSWCVLVTLLSIKQNFRYCRIWKYIQKVDDFAPMLLAILCLYFIIVRYKFTSRVCMCDFKDSYFLDREGWKWTNPSYVNGYSED
jgi:hypothetical protein